MTRPKLYVDLETRSRANLRATGAYVYAEDPTTEIVLFSWALGDAPVQTWYVSQGQPLPAGLSDALLDPGTPIVAHNAQFERILLSVVGPRRALRGRPDAQEAVRQIARYDCTASRAAHVGLPRTLEGAAQALGLPVQKDTEGSRLMLKMCVPVALDAAGGPAWDDDPARIARLGLYCERDVEVERLIDGALPALRADERAAWMMTERMNDRGIAADPVLLDALLRLVPAAVDDVNLRLAAATKGAVRRVTNHLKIREWLVGQGYEAWLSELGYADVKKAGVGKAVLADLLAMDGIPDLVREVMLLRQEGGKSSAAKFKAIKARSNGDARIRGSIVYGGAASTLRFSSRGTQLQNCPRGGTIKAIDQALDDVRSGAGIAVLRERYAPPLVVASELIRPTLVARDGHWLARGDYSQIEARVNPWLAGDKALLDGFRAYDAGAGPDLYKVTAARVFGMDAAEVDSSRRQIGKVAALALGFAGGVGAFQAFAKIYKVKVEDEKAREIVAAYREANQPIMRFGRALNEAAKACAAGPVGRDYAVKDESGRTLAPGVRFRRGSDAMAMRLPSGRCLVYWQPRVEKIEKPWGEIESVTYMAEDSQSKRWRRFAGWAGIFLENVTQATARDIMAEALVRLEANGLPPVLTVHDEAVCEVPRRRFDPSSAAEAVRAIMADPPAWASGLPIAVDASAGPRYVKG